MGNTETQNRKRAIKKECLHMDIAYTPGETETVSRRQSLLSICFATFSGSLLLNALAMLGKLLFRIGKGKGEVGLCLPSILELHVLPSVVSSNQPTLSTAQLGKQMACGNDEELKGAVCHAPQRKQPPKTDTSCICFVFAVAFALSLFTFLLVSFL